MSGGVWGAYFASDRKVLQLRVSNFEYFKMEPSTDFNSPSQCQHQHHHSYFVKMSKHKFNSGLDCEYCAAYADSMPKDGNGKFSFLFRSTVLVIIKSYTHLCNSINRSIPNMSSSSSRPSSSSSSWSSSTSSSSSIHLHRSSGVSSASVMTTQPADAIAGL